MAQTHGVEEVGPSESRTDRVACERVAAPRPSRCRDLGAYILSSPGPTLALLVLQMADLFNAMGLGHDWGS